jgi:hypothetical protein
MSELSSYKWKCNLDEDLNNRCSLEKSNGEYETYKKCQKICFNYQELQALSKINKLVEEKYTKPYVDPDTFTNDLQMEKIINSIKEIPLLHYFDKPYNNTIINIKESRKLYEVISTVGQPNNFFDDLINAGNCKKGKEFTYIEQLGEDGDKNIQTNFLNSPEFTNNFVKELNELKSNPKINYLVKEIISINLSSGHALISLCKFNKETNTFEFFAFDPEFSNENENIDILKEYIDIKLPKKLEDSKIIFINLSKFYGIQNFEIESFLHPKNIVGGMKFYDDKIQDMMIKFAQEMTADNTKSFYDIFSDSVIAEIKDKYLKSMRDKFKIVYERKDKDYIEILEYTFADYYQSFTKNIRWLLNAHNIYDVKNFAMQLNQYKSIMKENFVFFNLEMDKIRNDVYIKYKIDNYQMYCYLWCHYVCILMLINPSVNPHYIIKFAFYQTSNRRDMKEIYNEFKTKRIDESLLDLSSRDLLSKDRMKKKLKSLQIYKNQIISELSNPALLVHHKMLHIKITNLLYIISKYNLMANKKYFIEKSPILFSNIKPTMITTDIKGKENIVHPIVMNYSFENYDYIFKILDNLKFKEPLDSSIKEKILEAVINGINSTEIYELIIGLNPNNKTSSKQAGGDYYNKYLKYKMKYLEFKNKI